MQEDIARSYALHFAFCILHYFTLYETEMPSSEGETIVV
jgi:hypothetical protein